MRIRARNIGWFFLSLSMLIVAMASWVEHPGPSLAAATKDGAGWRVLIYMAADNDLEPAAHSNFLELNDALRRIEIPLVIQIDRSVRYSRTDGDWHGARRFVVRDGLNGSELQLEDDLGVIDSSSPERLREFLVWGMERLEARHTLVVLWGHGRGDRGMLRDEDSDGAMSIEELMVALEDLPIDVLALDLCSMQTLGVATGVGTRAHFLVGSQSVRHALGWPYSLLVEYLGSTTYVEPQALAVWMAKHAGDRGGAFTGSAVDLSRVSALSEALVYLQSRARQQPPDVRSNLLGKIESLPLISRGARSVDMGAALDVFEAEMPRETIVARDAYTRAILFSEGSRELIDATGLSIERSTLRDSIEPKVFDAR